MKRYEKLVFWMTLVLLSSTVLAQISNRFRNREAGVPFFEAKVLETYSEAEGKLLARAFIQIVNDDLTFVKSGDGFQAEVQIEIYLRHKSSDFVFNRTITQSVYTEDFARTNDQNIVNTFSTDMEVEEGEYEATITVLDQNNNEQYTRRTSFNISGTNAVDADLMVGDILFFDEFRSDENGEIAEFNPKLDNNFSSDSKHLYCYFNTFTRDTTSEMTVDYVVQDDRGLVVQQNRYVISSPEKGYQDHYIRLNRYYFSRNDYAINIKISFNGKSVQRTARFGFYWQFVPGTEKDLDLAIKQLRYIAKEDSIKYYLKKGSYEEKKAFFQRFWESKDPNPDTEANELMEEYYRRINYANGQFSSSGLGGWITDRGRIFIKFGQPDDVERHPFEANSYPYEIWRYYSLQKNFLFIDRTGFGDYDLHPSYYYVEYE